MIGPKGLTKAQTDYWDNIFSKLTSSDEWKAMAEKSLLENTYLNSEASNKFWAEQYDSVKAVLTKLGMAK